MKEKQTKAPLRAKLRLTIDVDIKLNGVTVSDMKQRLLALASYGYNEGCFTGSTEAEVNEYSYQVKERK